MVFNRTIPSVCNASVADVLFDCVTTDETDPFPFTNSTFSSGRFIGFFLTQIGINSDDDVVVASFVE